MNTLTVRWSAMDGAAQNMDQIGKRLGTIASSISNTSRNLSFSGASSGNLSRRLKTISQDLSGERQTISSLGNVLARAKSRYQSCESAISGETQKDGLQAVLQIIRNPAILAMRDSKDENGVSMVEKLLKDAIGEFGALGKGAGGVLDLLDGDKSNGEKAVDAGSASAGILGVIGSWMSQGMKKDEIMDYLLGINEKVIPEDTTFWNALKKEFSEYAFENSDDMTKAAKIGDRLSVGAKWAGGILSLAGNAFDNYEEYSEEGISAGRAVAETVTETAVDIGTDAILTAGVTAGLAALGFTAAPALVVGGGVVLAKWGLDCLCENLWGKDFTETVSDGILDMGEAIADGAKDLASNVADGAKKVCDAVGDAVGKTAKNITDGVSAAWGSFTSWAFG